MFCSSALSTNKIQYEYSLASKPLETLKESKEEGKRAIPVVTLETRFKTARASVAAFYAKMEEESTLRLMWFCVMSNTESVLLLVLVCNAAFTV